jgi:hypothetical protein
MVVDEQYMKVRRSLERKLGVEEASYLMDRPAGGWSQLVTNETLDLKLASLRHELTAEIHRSSRQQTWAVLTTLIAALALFATIFGLLART